ncbi:MAG TPA: hypothetical protein VGG33_15185 [Polyangia bacterium]
MLMALTLMVLAAAAPAAATNAPADDPTSTPTGTSPAAVALASLDLAATQPPVVAIQPGRQPGCPSTSSVESALLARIAGAVVSFDRVAEFRALVLGLAPLPANAGAELTLTDVDGRVRLRRQLSRTGISSKRADQSDCDALAETAALIVERYLAELDQPQLDLASAVTPVPVVVRPASPPPPPRAVWSLGLGNQYAVGEVGAGAFDLGLRLSRTLGARRAFFASLRAGAGLSHDPILDEARAGYRGRAKLQRFPAELGVGWRRSEGRVQPQLSAGFASDVTWVEAVGEDGRRMSQWLASPQAILEAAAQLSVTSRVYLRLSAAAVSQLVRYEFFSSPAPLPGQDPVFALPARRVQARLALEVGFSL